MFPEGTNLDNYSMEKSNKFAQKVGLPQLSYVLHPRTTGFQHLIRTFGSSKSNHIVQLIIGVHNHFRRIAFGNPLCKLNLARLAFEHVWPDCSCCVLLTR